MSLPQEAIAKIDELEQLRVSGSLFNTVGEHPAMLLNASLGIADHAVGEAVGVSWVSRSEPLRAGYSVTATMPPELVFDLEHPDTIAMFAELDAEIARMRQAIQDLEAD